MLLLRRAIRLLFPWLVLCAVFWKPLFESGVGLGAKAFLQVSRGWRLDYRSVAWEERGFVFTDLVLEDPGHFHLKADEAIASFSKKHLEVARPQVVLQELPSLKAGSFAWTLAVREGTLEGEGIERARFEIERKFVGSGGRFQLEWEGSALTGEVVEEQGVWRCDLLLKQFDPHSLRRWLGEEIGGSFSGRAYLVREGERWVRGMGHLEGREVSWGEHVRGMGGSFDWEGPFHWGEFSRAGRFRVSLEEGEWLGWSGMRGEWSFVGGMGTKWEFEGIGLEAFPVHWQGRGFFQSLKAHWIESDLACGEASFSLQGKKGEKWHWEGGCRNIEPQHAAFVQPFLTLLDPSFGHYAFLEGKFDVKGKVVGWLGALQEWELLSFSGEGLRGEGRDWTLVMEKGEYLPEGEFSFEQGSLEVGWLPVQSVWKGKGKCEGGTVCASEFEGTWGEFLFRAKASGRPEDFSIALEGEGPVRGEGTVAGRWDGERVFFSLDRGEVGGLCFAGMGSIDANFDFVAHVDTFSGPISTLWKLMRKESAWEGRVESAGNGLTIQGGKKGWDWALQAHLEEGKIPLFSYARLEEVKMELNAEREGFCCYGVRGKLVSGQEIPFYCPVVKSRGEFDVRLLGKTWDLLRFAGMSTAEGLIFDLKKSHFLGTRFRSAGCNPGFEKVELQLDLPWTSCLAALSHFSLPKEWIFLPLEGELALSFCYEKEEGTKWTVRGEDFLFEKRPLLLDLYAIEKEGRWTLDHAQCGDFTFRGGVVPDGEVFQIVQGEGKCKEGLDFTLEGRVLSQQMELKVPSMKVDLGLMSRIAERLHVPLQKMEGVLEGTGHLSWKEKFEADFDFAASTLRIGSMTAENQGPLHVYYSSDQGALFRGLDLQIHNPESDLPAFGWKIDLLQCDVESSSWAAHHSHLHVPKECFGLFSEALPFLETFPPTHDIDLIADMSSGSQFSFFEGLVQEGFLPFEGGLHRIQNAHFLWNENRCTGHFSYAHQGHLLKVGFQVDTDAGWKGRFTFEDEEHPEERPLTLDWSREDGTFLLHSVEGSFAGIDALFHREATHSLIGSARINFTELSEWVPPRIAEVFCDLKMGKGYEAKGRLYLEPSPAFRGLLSGKQLELFGYQLRTLLGQLELTPEKVHISDLKVSDSAGMLKIEELIARGKEGEPWTIAMPHLTITELRPCLLQKVGETLGPPTPLVVRELKLDDFKGFLEDSRTFTAAGDLVFINSYRRDHTVFDLPADVLSRIVGLDLELLIPARGSLRFELKDRLFRLVELKDSYSEGKRSQFFLVHEGNSPTMDLDGNLQILVKMKQFVLFKFTESFLISIDGKLDEPKFHLQKKRRFLGL